MSVLFILSRKTFLLNGISILSKVSLTVVGGINYIAKIQSSDISVSIDFTSQWSPKKQFYEPTIIVPEEIVKWKDLTPRNIELAVAKESD